MIIIKIVKFNIVFKPMLAIEWVSFTSPMISNFFLKNKHAFVGILF